MHFLYYLRTELMNECSVTHAISLIYSLYLRTTGPNISDLFRLIGPYLVCTTKSSPSLTRDVWIRIQTIRLSRHDTIKRRCVVTLSFFYGTRARPRRGFFMEALITK